MGDILPIRPRPRPTAPTNDPPGSGGGVSRPPRELPQESRQRLSEIATKRHQNGEFRPVPGRPKRKPSRRRIAELVAQAALEEKTAKDIIEVFKDGIAPTQPIHIRLKAAEAWLKVDHEEAKLELKEAATEDERMDREAALAFLADRLSQGHTATLLRKQLSNGGIIDAEVVDVDDE